MTRLTITLATVAGLTSGALAQVSFDDPVELDTGGKNFSNVIYSIPVLIDIDNDGQQELVIGDLRGYIMSAEMKSADTAAGWLERSNVQADGKPLKLNNW